MAKYSTKEEELVVEGELYRIKATCGICSKFFVRNNSPPQLIAKPQLPPYVMGEWISARCENRPLGLYLTRNFTFTKSENGMVWIAEHKFYSDPFCIVPKFTVTASGTYSLGQSNQGIADSTEIDFSIEEASLSIYNRFMMHQMQSTQSCGTDLWRIGVPQQLSYSNGCLRLGLIIPSIQYDVMKVDIDYQGNFLLFLGQADTENLPRAPHERPTAFQPPLVKCGDVVGVTSTFGMGMIFSMDSSGSVSGNSVIIPTLYLCLSTMLLRR